MMSFQSRNRQNFVTSIALYIVLLIIFGFEVAKTFVSLLFFALIALELIVRIKKWRAEREFRREFILFLHQLALNMQMGSAFRSSYKESLPFFKGHFRKKMEDIFHFVTFSQHSNGETREKFENRVVNELVRVDKDEKQSRKRIQNFKKSLDVEEFFRHRSKQMSSGVRFQLLVLAVIYLLISFSILKNFGADEVRGYFLASVTFFVTGSVVFFRIGAKKAWKL